MKKYISLFMAIAIIVSTFSSTSVFAASNSDNTLDITDATENYVIDTWNSEEFQRASAGKSASAEANTDEIQVREETQSASATKSVSTEENVDDIWVMEETQSASATKSVSTEENVDDIWVMEETQSASATKSVSTEENVDDIWFAEETSAAKFSLDTDENVVDYPDEELSIVTDNQGIRTATTDEMGAEEENVDDYPSEDSIEGITTSDEETERQSTFAAAVLTISPSTNWTGISASGGTRTISITTNLGSNYTVNRPSWFNATTFPSAGKFQLNVPANNTSSTRTGTVNVTGGGLTRSFSVSQLAGSSSLSISPSTNWTGIAASGGTRIISVSTNTSYTVNRPSWFSATTFPSAGKFQLNVPANNTSSTRTGTVNVTGGGLTRSFSVSQLAGSSSLSISPSTNWTGIAASGGTRIISVSTNTSYTVNRPSWFSATTFPSAGKFQLNVPANTTSSTRTGTVNVTGGGITRSFSVSQLAGSATLSISPSTDWTNIPVSGGTRIVTITTNIAGDITVNRPTWFNATTFGSGTFTLSCPANTTSSARTGTVNVTGGGITRSFSVSQLAGSASLTISPSTDWTGIAASGGTRIISVSTNTSYTVNRPSWFNATTFGSGTFTLSCPANTTSSTRTSTVNVTGGGITRSFSVSQLAGSSALTISPNTDWTNIQASGGTRTISVSTNTDYTVYRPQWFNATTFGNGTFTLNCPANTTSATRTGTVDVTGGGITRSFNVSQLAGSATLTISPSTDWTSIPVSGGTRTVTITTNIAGNIDVYRPTWFNATTFGSGTFTLSCPANTTSTTRTGTVKVEGGGITRSFNVSQLAGSSTTNVTITWNNNYSGAPASTTTTKTSGSQFGTLPASAARTGYTFDGWYSNTGGTGTNLVTTSIVPNTNTTYYAKWTSSGTSGTYASLNFAYPLDSQYNGRFDNYSGHLGLDISAPKDARIYSVDSGVVNYAGHVTSTGYYISITNDKTDPTKTGSNNMVTRYLHINESNNVFVVPGQRVTRSQNIGLVGSRGTFVGGTRYNHLHLDANSSGIGSGAPGSAYIYPEQFWPGTFQTGNITLWPGSDSDWSDSLRSPAFSARSNEILSDQEIIESGEYIDIELIRLIGFDEFETWLLKNPNGTVYELIEDYEITNNQLESELADHIYESYEEFSPVEFEAQFTDSNIASTPSKG